MLSHNITLPVLVAVMCRAEFSLFFSRIDVSQNSFVCRQGRRGWLEYHYSRSPFPQGFTFIGFGVAWCSLGLSIPLGM